MIQRRQLAILTALLLVGCAMLCFAVQPIKAAAHDCCPKAPANSNCPEMKGVSCVLNAFDVPKATTLLSLVLFAMALAITPLLIPAATRQLVPIRVTPSPPERVYLRNRVFRI